MVDQKNNYKNMKKILFTTIFITFLAFTGSTAFAHTETAESVIPNSATTSAVFELPDPGMLPDHPLYFLKSTIERIGNGFAFSEEAKIKRGIKIAERRLAEAIAMIDSDNNLLVEKTFLHYSNKIEDIENRLKNLGEGSDKYDSVISRVAEATLYHQDALSDLIENKSDEASERLQEALERSMQGHETSLSALSGEKRTEIEGVIREKKEMIEDKINQILDRKGSILDIPQN